MSELIYKLILKNPEGDSVRGNLNYRFTDLDLPAASDLAQLVAETQLQRPKIELSIFTVQGTFTAPLATGPLPIPISGICLVSLVGPTLSTLFSSIEGTGLLGLQFNGIDSDAQHIGGGLLWRPLGLEQVWSVLGTRTQ
ncbi:hypothetical protein ACLB1G_07445 [Oxalobacteraceae bacterium A2-2]